MKRRIWSLEEITALLFAVWTLKSGMAEQMSPEAAEKYSAGFDDAVRFMGNAIGIEERDIRNHARSSPASYADLQPIEWRRP